MQRRGQAGFTLLEMMVGLTVMLIAMGGVMQLLIHNARLNKASQLTVETQTNARNCLDIILPRLRNAGWDPTGASLSPVVLDPDLGDGISQIEILADLVDPPDGLTDGTDEQILIRHIGNRVEWRRTVGGDFETLSNVISNDADGDGFTEPMFLPIFDAFGNPTRITVRITAESPEPHPVSREAIRYTVSADVVLRSLL